jgi:hypothetical protein
MTFRQKRRQEPIAILDLSDRRWIVKTKITLRSRSTRT